ncbi:MAG: hypothetical protein II822_07425 [Prevotella sp.]|nr:hypothetical protein [Prevotella sp.]
MQEILCRIKFDDSNKTAKFWFLQGKSMGVLEAVEDDVPQRCPTVDERMRMALVQLREDLKSDKKKMYGYDYAWILKLIKEYNGKGRPEFKDYVFNGTTDYHNYLLELGIEGVAGVSVLNEYANLVKDGDAKDWRFYDEPRLNAPDSDKQKRRNCSPAERARRNGIVSRFLVIYRQLYLLSPAVAA